VDADEGHSILGASGMYRWEVCPGSVTLNRGIPNQSSKFAEEGTLAHEIGAAALVGGEIMTDDDGMYEALETYLLHVNTIRDRIDANVEKALGEKNARLDQEGMEWVEYPVHLKQIDPRLWGTADYVAYDPVEMVMYVRDYKHGAGVYVEVKNNPQLLYYALAVYFTILLPLGLKVKKIDLGIVQPRYPYQDGPTRSIVMPLSKLLGFTNRLISAVYRADHATTEFNPGKGCQFCPAAKANKCTKVRKMAINMFAKNEVVKDINEFGHLLEWFGVFRGWMSKVEETAFEDLNDGLIIDGWGLEPKRGKRKFGNEKAVARTLQSKKIGLLQNQIYDVTLKSPAQIDKLLSPDKRKIVAALSTTESSGLKLAPEQRDESHDPQQAFSKVTK
jgi:hypothetical protein